MSTARSYTPFFASALLMYAVLLIIYPHYQYYIDPDGTAYLTISQRYANGDLQKAINGYWSPWSCWLTAALIKWSTISAVPASWLVNTLGATGFLYISQSFFLKFNVAKQLQWILCATLALFLVYAIFWQSFDDLWECFFLLSALRIMLADRFVKSPVLWVTCGVIGALAYFAKAYAFPFFMLNTCVCSYLLTRGNIKKWLMMSSVTIITVLLCSMPWIAMLHGKYGIWTTSTAGSLNMSWYLVGHPYYREAVDVLIPPVYGDSPSYWEDPYLVSGISPHFWDSSQLLGRQILKIGHNIFKFMVSGLQISVFFPVIFIVALISLFNRKARNLFSANARVLVVSFLLFPLAYFLVNFEARYIWYMLPLAMVMGAITIQGIKLGNKRKVLTCVFPVTFLIYPVWGMNAMYDTGIRDHETGQQLKAMNIEGAFVSMAKPGIERQSMLRIAYFANMQFYDLAGTHQTKADVLTAMDKYPIKYFLVADSITSQSRMSPNERPVLHIDSSKDANVVYITMY